MTEVEAKIKTKRVKTVSFNIQQTVPFLYRQIITEVEAKIKITTKMVVHTVYSNFHQPWPIPPVMQQTDKKEMLQEAFLIPILNILGVSRLLSSF